MDLLDRQHAHRLSQELTDIAGELRTAVAAVRGQATANRWRSPAAGACARAIELTLSAALRLAANLDDTAAAVGAHGRRACDVAERAATAGTSVAAHGVRMLERLAGR